MALHSRDAVTVSAVVASRSRADCSSMEGHTSLSRASDFPFQKKQFSVSKKVKFRFNSVSLLVTLNSMKSQYIERKCGERTVKMAQLVQ